MNELEAVIRELMVRRGITTQKDLADRIGISEQAISKILDGRSKPRSGTLKKLVDALCQYPKDKARLMGAAYGLAAESITPPPPVDLTPSYVQEAVSRGTEYGEAKASAISFRADIEAALKARDVEFVRDKFIYTPEDRSIVCDFYVECRDEIIALGAKTNLREGWERMLGEAIVIKESLPGATVAVVVPYRNPFVEFFEPIFRKSGIALLEFDDFLKQADLRLRDDD